MSENVTFLNLAVLSVSMLALVDRKIKKKQKKNVPTLKKELILKALLQPHLQDCV